jgi:predicted nucleotidyltransferase|tara:strand:+ start:1613 stop:2593 length:981 start_codon:yes stop_codon:yes gene_type:complete
MFQLYSLNDYRSHLIDFRRSKKYNRQNNDRSKKKCQSDEIIIHQLDNSKNYGIEWVKKLDEIIRDIKIQNIVKDIIIHGSYGDGTYTNFSDIELTVVLNDRFENDEIARKRLLKWIRQFINPFIIKLDPLQHHGVFLLWPNLMENYNECILPILAYDNSWSINGSVLKFSRSVEIDKNTQKNRMLMTINKLLMPDADFFQFGIHMYSIKRLISNYLMLIPLYYQSQGIAISKKQAISEIIQNGPSSVINAINIASELRRIWPKTPAIYGNIRQKIIKNNIPNGMIDEFIISFYRNKFIENKFKSMFLPILPKACSEFISMIENENN